jgi:capsular polysaccharide transport system permease protein
MPESAVKAPASRGATDASPPAGVMLEEIELAAASPDEPQTALARARVVLPALAPPAVDAPRRSGGRGAFFALFVAPTLAAALYFGLIASDVFVSEGRFLVRSRSSAAMSPLVQGIGISRASDETFAVESYLRSRNVVTKLRDGDGLLAIYARPEADMFNRCPAFWTRNDFEELYEHYLNWTSTKVDEAAGIVTVRADAFRPDDARALADAMIRHAEELVNQLNARAFNDRVSAARKSVEEARVRVADVERRITELRNQRRIVDPMRESTAALEAIGKMTTELAQMEASLKQQIDVAPRSPTIPTIRQRVESYRAEIAKLREKIVGGEASMSQSLPEYEQLMLERTLDARALELATLNLDKAEQETEQRHVYLERIADPHTPDYPEAPRRVLGFLSTMLVSLGVYTIVRTLRRIALEHTP